MDSVREHYSNMAAAAGCRISTHANDKGDVKITVYAGENIRSPHRSGTLPANASAAQTVQLVAGMIRDLKRQPQPS